MMLKSRIACSMSLVIVGLASACGSGAASVVDSGATQDAPAYDASLAVDASTMRDATSTTDAMDEVDAAVPLDADTSRDANVSWDASASWDAGPVLDASSSMDAMSVADAAMPLDGMASRDADVVDMNAAPDANCGEGAYWTDGACADSLAVRVEVQGLRLGRGLRVRVRSTSVSADEAMVFTGARDVLTDDAAAMFESGDDYAVSIVEQPSAQTCEIDSTSDISSGTFVATNVHIRVVCTDNPAHVFMVNGYSSQYVRCRVDDAGAFVDCTLLAIPMETISSSALHIFGDDVYILGTTTSGSFTKTVHCKIDAETLAFTACTSETSTQSAEYPFGMAMRNGLAYITNYGPDNTDAVYTTCAVGDDGLLSSCSRAHTSPAPTAGGGADMLVIDDHAYIALFDGAGDSLLRCGFNDMGALTDCTTITPTSPGTLDNPSGLAYFAGRLYISNSAYDFPLDSGYTHCAVESDGTLSDCQRVNPDDVTLFSTPLVMTFINDRAYFANSGVMGSYTRCDVRADGELAACVVTDISGLDTASSIAVYQR